MNVTARSSIRSRLTFLYVSVLAILLILYAAIVFAFQYATLTKQIFHDEVQDVETVEGLLYFDEHNALRLRQDYYSRPQSHLLVDRLMEVRDLAGNSLYQSATLHGASLGGANQPGEGDASFNERIVRLSNGQHVFLISHLHTMNGRVLLIRLGYSLAALRERMQQFLLLLLIALPVTLALAALAGQNIARRALLPLAVMATRADGISASNLHDRLSVVNAEDELGQLAIVFNRLLQRLEQAFQQLHRFTADAAHELRTPLASLRTVGEVALETESTPKAYRDALGNILEESDRLNETIESLLLLAKAEAATASHAPERIALGGLIDEVLGVLAVLIEEKQLTVKRFGPELGTTEIAADRSLFRVALLNVLHNAIKFSPAGASLEIGLSLPGAPDGSIALTVEDQGPGLQPQEMERVFDRFYRGRDQPLHQQAGTGLGLSIAKLVVQRAGGDIRFDADVTSGARCILTLPILSES